MLSTLWYPQTAFFQAWHMIELSLWRQIYRKTTSMASGQCLQLSSSPTTCLSQGSACSSHGNKVGLILPSDEEIQSKYSSFKSTSPRMHLLSCAKAHQYISTYFPWDCHGNLRNFQLRPENDPLINYFQGNGPSLEELGPCSF